MFLNHSLLFNYLELLKHDAEVGHELSGVLSQNVTQKKSVVFPPQTLLSLPTRRYHKLTSPKRSTRQATTQPVLQIIKMEVLPFPQLTHILGSLFPRRPGQESISSSRRTMLRPGHERFPTPGRGLRSAPAGQDRHRRGCESS